MQSLCSTCNTKLAKSSYLYHLSLKPYSYKQSCNSVCISKLASMSVNYTMKRCLAELHALRHKTPLNTRTPLSKLTRILSGVCWKLWLQKMATQIWQNANLEKMSWQCARDVNPVNHFLPEKYITRPSIFNWLWRGSHQKSAKGRNFPFSCLCKIYIIAINGILAFCSYVIIDSQTPIFCWYYSSKNYIHATWIFFFFFFFQ